jgi:hypothetical protein
VYLKKIAILAPGIENWEFAKKLFNNLETYEPAPLPKNLNSLLPANERRRCSRTSQLALGLIQQIVKPVHPPTDDTNIFNPHSCRYVFTSCNGDLTVFHQISTALTLPGYPVSPIKFHNSVHNAPAGYSSIALKSTAPSTSICAFDDSFANGLMESVVQLTIESQDTLLLGYDEVPPEPLYSLFPVDNEFACAFLLSKKPLNANYKLEIETTNGKEINSMQDLLLEQLRNSNPQAKVLPLLFNLATNTNSTIYLSYNKQQLAIHVTCIK